MSKFTTGKWARSGYCDCDSCYHIGPEVPGLKTGIRVTEDSCIEDLVADVWDNPNMGDSESNANLISASPDMYKALTDALKVSEFEHHAYRP